MLHIPDSQLILKDCAVVLCIEFDESKLLFKYHPLNNYDSRIIDDSNLRMK